MSAILRETRQDGGSRLIEAVQNDLLQEWGWSHSAPDHIRKAARSVAISRAEGYRSGDVAVALKCIGREELERLIELKPRSRRTIDWVAENSPEVARHREKIQSIASEYPYIESIDGLTRHPLLDREDALYDACERLESVLVETDRKIPFLIFSSFVNMTNYDQMGRGEQARDPIHAVLESEGYSEIAIGCAEGNQVIKLLRRTETGARRSTQSDGESSSVNRWERSSHDSPAQKQLGQLLEAAIASRASDVAIEPEGAGAKVLVRISTEMQPSESHPELSQENYQQALRFLLNRSGANEQGGRLQKPADGRILFISGARQANIRCSFIPVGEGDEDDRETVSISLRLMERGQKDITLDDLNMSDEVKSAFRKAARFHQGMILLSGPTNSGKSTTIAGVLAEHEAHHGYKKKRLSIEDPIERRIRGVRQLKVPPFWGEDGFEMLFRASLRHDPDLIFLGEIRDEATAETATKAANSGHLVLSTAHATDPVTTYRAVANRVPKEKRFDLIESLLLIVAQRLVKELCPGCRVMREPDDMEIEVFEEFKRSTGEVSDSLVLPKLVPIENADGCPDCGHTGSIGVLPIHEVFWVTRDVKDLLLEMESGGFNRRALNEHRMGSLLRSGLDLVRQGRVQVDSVFV